MYQIHNNNNVAMYAEKDIMYKVRLVFQGVSSYLLFTNVLILPHYWSNSRRKYIWISIDAH